MSTRAGARGLAAVIFDNDGLLLDTESVWTRAEQVLYERRGLEFTHEHKQELVGTSAEIAGAIISDRLGEPGRATEVMAELDTLVMAELGRGADPMPGAPELLAFLREQGLPVALVSNSPRAFIDLALEVGGISKDAFDVTVSGHEVPSAKPAPDPYLRACDLLGLEPGHHITVLEDSPSGVTAALAAGLRVIGVPSVPGVELPGAHERLSSLEDERLHGLLGL